MKLKTPHFIAITVGSLMAAAAFMFYNPKAKMGLDNKTDIVIKGSESEFNLIIFFSSAYKKTHADINFDITGGGSGKGIEALLKNETHIANSSRSITDEELKEADKNNLNIAPYIIAGDAVAIITHRAVGVDSLSLDQLKSIFNGSVKNWKEVGGLDLPIVIFGRDNHSGTYHYLLNRFQLTNFPSGTSAFSYNYQIINQVETQKGAIGYVSLGAITDLRGKPYHGVWTVSMYIDGGRACSPFDIEAVKYGDYPLTRPLYQYAKKDANSTVLDFIKFELAPRQQADLEKHGYFPITPIHQVINNKNSVVL
jgi:phosphate transport system substrate-binding protein